MILDSGLLFLGHPECLMFSCTTTKTVCGVRCTADQA